MVSRKMLEEIKWNTGADDISLSKDIITVRRGFFYTMGKTADDYVQRVLKAYPKAKIIDSGEVWRTFRGGASVRTQSHWFVKFKL